MIRRGPDRDHAPGEWECGSGRVVATFHYYRGPAREEAICIAFHCRARGGDVRLSNEHDAAEWVPLDRVVDVPVSQPLRDCIARFVKTHRRRSG